MALKLGPLPVTGKGRVSLNRRQAGVKLPVSSVACDGESIELLELSFRIEKHFGVRVRFNDLTANDIELDAEGRLTPASLAVLKTKYSFLKLAVYETRPLERRTDLLTIEAIAGFVQLALAAKQTAGAMASDGVKNQ